MLYYRKEVPNRVGKEESAGTSLRCAHDTARCPMMSGEAICTILGRKAAMSCRTARGRPMPTRYSPRPGSGNDGMPTRRTEESRVGKEGVSTCSARGWPHHSKIKKNKNSHTASHNPTKQ